MAKNKYLTGNIICALPQLKDLFFSRRIIYITHHNADGAVGIILNYKIMNIDSSELFQRLNLDKAENELDFSLHIGGPMSQHYGFILHTRDYKSNDTINITNSINLTCSTQIIEDIVLQKGPNKYFISLGYSGWGPGQLEKEIINNSWIHLSEKLDLIFNLHLGNFNFNLCKFAIYYLYNS